MLDQPQLLLELQEQVFVAGGDYWQTVPITPHHQQTHERVLAAGPQRVDGIRLGQVELGHLGKDRGHGGGVGFKGPGDELERYFVLQGWL